MGARTDRETSGKVVPMNKLTREQQLELGDSDLAILVEVLSSSGGPCGTRVGATLDGTRVGEADLNGTRVG